MLIPNDVRWIVSFDPGSWVGAYAIFRRDTLRLQLARAINYRKSVSGISDTKLPERCAMVGRMAADQAKHDIAALEAISAASIASVSTGVFCVSEYPIIYRGSPAKPDSMLGLAACSGAFAASVGCMSLPDGGLGSTRDVNLPWMATPAEWKGNEPPDQCCARIRSALGADEIGECVVDFGAGSCKACSTVDQANVGPCEKKSACVAHNVLDAIGIGLWALGRFEPRHTTTIRNNRVKP